MTLNITTVFLPAKQPYKPQSCLLGPAQLFCCGASSCPPRASPLASAPPPPRPAQSIARRTSDTSASPPQSLKSRQVAEGSSGARHPAHLEHLCQPRLESPQVGDRHLLDGPPGCLVAVSGQRVEHVGEEVMHGTPQLRQKAAGVPVGGWGRRKAVGEAISIPKLVSEHVTPAVFIIASQRGRTLVPHNRLLSTTAFAAAGDIQ